MTREIQWPGRQLNNINEFRDKCYEQCYHEEPIGSDWHNKLNGCGAVCKASLEEYIFSQGKNPCVLKLSPPVFWHPSDKRTELCENEIVEGYQGVASERPLLYETNSSGNNVSNGFRLFLYILSFVVTLILSFLLLTVLYYAYRTPL